MKIRRIVPDIYSAIPQETRDFYVDLLDLEVAMDLWRRFFVRDPNGLIVNVMCHVEG